MTRQARIAALAVILLGIGSAIGVVGEENVAGLFAIGSSARGQGLGGAFSALADDEGAVYHSPAALGWGEGIGLSSLFVQQFGGVLFGSLGIRVPYAGANVFLLDSGPIPADTGTLRFSSQGVAASVGIPLGMVGLGVRWRYYRVSSPSPGTGWAIDPALLAIANNVRVSLIYEAAASAPISYRSGTAEAWPRGLLLGAALTLDPTDGVRWNAAIEASGLFTSEATLSAGLEAWIGGLGARVGFDGEGPTFGLSLLFPTLRVDWAFSTRSDLGNSHRVALALRF